MANPKNPNNRNNNERDVNDQDSYQVGSLLIGIGFAVFLGLSGLAYYVWGRPQTNSVIVVPAPAASQQPDKQTTIIEKTNTIERVLVPAVTPAPQQSAPNVNVRVNVPQVPTQGKTDVRVVTPNNPQPATAPQNTTINVAPAESTTKTSTPTTSPQASPSTPKAGATINSNP